MIIKCVKSVSGGVRVSTRKLHLTPVNVIGLEFDNRTGNSLTYISGLNNPSNLRRVLFLRGDTDVFESLAGQMEKLLRNAEQIIGGKIKLDILPD